MPRLPPQRSASKTSVVRRPEKKQKTTFKIVEVDENGPRKPKQKRIQRIIPLKPVFELEDLEEKQNASPVRTRVPMNRSELRRRGDDTFINRIERVKAEPSELR